MSDNTVQSDADKVVVQSNDDNKQDTDSTNGWTAAQLADRLKIVNQEAKENRKRAQDEKKRREEQEKTALAEKGQFKELAEVWQRKATEAESKSQKLTEAFALKSVSDTVVMEAQRLGCVDPEALASLINLKDLPLDDGFNVDRAHVRAVLEDVRKAKPYFFQKPAPKVLDTTPAKSDAPPAFDLNKLSLQERAQMLTQLKNQGK